MAEQIQERVGGGHDRVPGWGAYEEALPRPPQGYSWHQTVTEALAANPFLAGVLRVLGELAPGSLVGAVPVGGDNQTPRAISQSALNPSPKP